MNEPKFYLNLVRHFLKKKKRIYITEGFHWKWTNLVLKKAYIIQKQFPIQFSIQLRYSSSKWVIKF